MTTCHQCVGPPPVSQWPVLTGANGGGGDGGSTLGQEGLELNGDHLDEECMAMQSMLDSDDLTRRTKGVGDSYLGCNNCVPNDIKGMVSLAALSGFGIEEGPASRAYVSGGEDNGVVSSLPLSQVKVGSRQEDVMCHNKNNNNTEEEGNASYGSMDDSSGGGGGVRSCPCSGGSSVVGGIQIGGSKCSRSDSLSSGGSGDLVLCDSSPIGHEVSAKELSSRRLSFGLSSDRNSWGRISERSSWGHDSELNLNSPSSLSKELWPLYEDSADGGQLNSGSNADAMSVSSRQSMPTCRVSVYSLQSAFTFLDMQGNVCLRVCVVLLQAGLKQRQLLSSYL